MLKRNINLLVCLSTLLFVSACSFATKDNLNDETYLYIYPKDSKLLKAKILKIDIEKYELLKSWFSENTNCKLFFYLKNDQKKTFDVKGNCESYWYWELKEKLGFSADNYNPLE